MSDRQAEEAEERALVKLAAVVEPTMLEFAFAEVNRREAVFIEHWSTSPHVHHESARLAALESVYLDATYGRI